MIDNQWCFDDMRLGGCLENYIYLINQTATSREVKQKLTQKRH